MIDIATLRRWIEELGYAAEPAGPSTFRIRMREPGIVEMRPFFLQCTENWVVLSMLGVLEPQKDSDASSMRVDLARRLLELNREMRVAKFALGDQDDVILCAELPTESLDRSEVADAVERIIEYATTYRRELLGVSA